MTVRLLSEADIFDVYGCEILLRGNLLDHENTQAVIYRLEEIQAIYVASAKARIRAEARFLGGNIDVELTFENMLSKVRDIIGTQLAKQSAVGAGNVMQTILKAHMMAGNKNLDTDTLSKFGITKQEPPADKSVDPDWFLNKKRGTHMWDDVKWHEISKAFVDLEQARSPFDITFAIDRLNTLQHNSFHLLIDLQNGRMLDNQSTGELHGDYERSRKNVQLVLNMVHDKAHPIEFADKMSPNIRKLMNRYAKPR